MAAVEQMSMHWLQPGCRDRLCAQIDGLYAKYFGFSNSPVIVGDFHRRRGLRDGIGAGGEITLRRLVHGEVWRALEIEHEIEAFAARDVAPREVDRGRRAAGGDACAMRLAAIEVDLEREIDRLLGTRVHALVAARAKVEVDRIFLRPGDIERAEPAGDLADAARVHRKVAFRGKLGAAARPVTRTVTPRWADSDLAQCSAASAGPTISRRPSER